MNNNYAKAAANTHARSTSLCCQLQAAFPQSSKMADAFKPTGVRVQYFYALRSGRNYSRRTPIDFNASAITPPWGIMLSTVRVKRTYRKFRIFGVFKMIVFHEATWFVKLWVSPLKFTPFRLRPISMMFRKLFVVRMSMRLSWKAISFEPLRFWMLLSGFLC